MRKIVSWAYLRRPSVLSRWICRVYFVRFFPLLARSVNYERRHFRSDTNRCWPTSLSSLPRIIKWHSKANAAGRRDSETKQLSLSFGPRFWIIQYFHILSSLVGSLQTRRLSLSSARRLRQKNSFFFVGGVNSESTAAIKFPSDLHRDVNSMNKYAKRSHDYVRQIIISKWIKSGDRL